MIGKTNSRLGSSDLLVENVRIRLLSNQPSHEGLVGSGFTLSYETFTKNYEWDGNEVYVQVPSHLEYTIAFHAVDGYKTPVMVTYTANGGNERDIVGMYYTELLTVNVSADEGTVSGYKITISKGTSVTQTTTTGTYKIPHGTSYTISASSVNGYTSPSKITRVASEASYVASMQYEKIKHGGTTNPSYGVYIQDTDGYFHTASEWNGTYTADCVAVIAEECRFGIALSSFGVMKMWSSSPSYVANYMNTSFTSSSLAMADYNGAKNTADIMKWNSSTDYAAGACSKYTFPSGKKGFLPACGQIYVARNNTEAIQTALSKVGGTTLNTGLRNDYWSSTFYEVYNEKSMFWILAFDSMGAGSDYLNYNHYVRAFCSL